MLVRSGTEGDWLPLRPLEGLPEGGVRTMCGSDVGAMLELDEAMPVVAWGPWPTGASSGVDAVCLTAGGAIELVVATHGEAARDTLWRLVDVASTLAGTTVDAFVEHCTELHGSRDLGAWLEARCGADPERALAALADALERGAFGVVVLTPDGAPALQQPLALLARAATRVRSFTVQVQRAGSVYAVEATLAGEHAEDAPTRQQAAVSGAAAYHLPVPEVVPMPQPPVPPEPCAAAEPAPADPQPQSQPEPAPVVDEDELEIVASSEPDFLASVDRLDHRTSADLRWLHDALRSLVEEVEYTTDGELVHVTGWRMDGRRRPLYGLDSQGLLQLVLTSLPVAEQEEFAGELATLLPDDRDGAALLASGFAEVDVPEHLGDQTLLEYLVDNLVEALPGGRDAFGTHAAEGGQDYFDGVSPDADPAEVVDLTGRDAA